MQPQIYEIASVWSNKWANILPMAEKLKERYPDRWVRFDTLPNSKRYPDNEDEYTTILNRHDSLLKRLGDGDILSVISCEWTNDPSVHSLHDSIRANIISDSTYWQTFKDDDGADPEFQSYRHIYISKLAVGSDAANALLRAVAANEISGVIFAPNDFDWLYHPYDGGVDVITATQNDRDELRKQFQNWLPK
jgi:hypothetical protein